MVACIANNAITAGIIRSASQSDCGAGDYRTLR
jgi:hypothetical protein